MNRQQLNNGSWFDRDKATKYDEYVPHNGNNSVSVHTNDQWRGKTLWKTASGTYVMCEWSAWQGESNRWYVVTEDEANYWFYTNEDYDKLPPEFLASKEV